LPVLEKGFSGRAGCPPHNKFILCGTGILPVLENGARCEIFATFPLTRRGLKPPSHSSSPLKWTEETG